MWLRQSTIDGRLTIAIADEARGVRFVVRREGVVLGERTLDVAGVPCQDIHAAVALGIATAIDATILGDLGATPRAPAVPARPILLPTPPPMIAPALPLPTPFVPPLPPAVRAHGPVLTTTLQGMVLVGVLPKVTVGVAPSADVSITRSVDLRASALATGHATVDVGRGTAEAGLVAGRLDACATRVLLDDVARIRACGGIVAGVVSAQGAGFADPRTTTSLWVAPTLRFDARWSLTRYFGLVIGADGFFPGLRPELQVVDKSGATLAAETFPLAGVGVSVGPSLTF